MVLFDKSIKIVILLQTTLIGHLRGEKLHRPQNKSQYRTPIVSFLYHEGGDFTQPTKWFMTSVIKSSQMRQQDMPHTAVEFRTLQTDANCP